ncbi:hypothetical protein [Piscirickettsia litoralis]|uniref:Uncharacterized protein n=1 Tax=Piscirickettsia litoralis TaxID=1891921 RepID=A0ABX2ZYH1_9GAMM|nr:hypothetical protein [Piscirickettsia litoralis]ODN41671.1 hypothetical protein BGC07_00085 [Piscirickettsia litoralis]
MNEKKQTWKDIKPVLAKMTAIQLRGILQDLYLFSSENKAFFHSRFLNRQGGCDHLKPYKARIREAICPKEPWKQDVQLSVGRKAISEFKKANGDLRDTLNLMLYYVVCGNDFTLEFGDINEPFYNSMESMFGRLIEMLIKQKDDALVIELMPRLEAESKRVELVGWGYGDGIRELLGDLQEAFPESCGVVG